MDTRKFFVLLAVVLLGAVVFAAPWDFLRPGAGEITLGGSLISWAVFIVSFVILEIALAAYRKSRSKRLLLVSAAFGLFFLKRFLIVLDIYYSPGEFMNTSIQGFFDLLVMLGFFVALFWKK